MNVKQSKHSTLLVVATLLLGGFLLGGFLPRPSAAQDIRVTALVSETTIGTEEELTYTVEIQGEALPEITTPEPPRTTGLALASTYPSTSRNISVVNGDMSVSIGFTWRFRPLEEGKAVIQPATIVAGGKSYTTNSVTVEVVPQSERPARRRLLGGGSGPSEISERDLFIRANPSKRRVFQNEQIILEYGLYFRDGIQLRQSRLADSWDAEGFWREELAVESRPVPRVVVENGIRYNMIVLKRVAVFPTRSGSLEIDPLKIQSEASPAFGSRDPFFALRSRYQPIELSSKPIRIESVDYPTPAPESFRGAVGRYTMDVSLDRSDLEVGESAQLTVVISGTGNVATLEGPEVELPGIFEEYDPNVESSVNRSGSAVRGSKTFTYVLIPRSNGTFEIPPVEFSYLNPADRSYETLTSDAFRVSVTGDVASLSPAIATAGGLPVDDIPPILTEARRWRAARTPLHRSPLVYGLVVLPLMLAAAAIAWKRREGRIATDVQYARRRRANPIAKKVLREAESLRSAGDARAFYSAIDAAVRGFVGDRLNVGEKAMTIGEFCATVGANGAEAQTVTTISTLLEECERARFAPVSPDPRVVDTALERATTVIEDLNVQLNSDA